MRIPGADKAIENLMKWSAKDEWAPFREEVFAAHFDMACDHFDTTEEDIADLLGGAFGMVFGCALEDFFAARFGDQGEQNVIDDYLKRRGWREKAPAKLYLKALRDSVMSLYEVVDLEPGRSMSVQDLVLGGDPITVDEKLGSESAAKWDRIAARIVTVNKKTCFTGTLLPFRREAAGELLFQIEKLVKKARKELHKEAKKLGEAVDLECEELREALLTSSAHLFTQTWLVDALECAAAPLPEIRNSDGDEILFSEARFPITADATKLTAALNEIGELERADPDALRWDWYGQGSPSRRMSRGEAAVFDTDDNTGRTLLGDIEIRKGALFFTTNSKERADRGRDLLRSRLDGLVGQPLTSHKGLPQMFDERAGALPPQPEVPAEAIQAFMDDHYRRTLDDPLPYLDGKTPRQAARTKKGRAQVIDWLKELENSEARRTAGQGQGPYDFRWMWRELKIDYPG